MLSPEVTAFCLERIWSGSALFGGSSDHEGPCIIFQGCLNRARGAAGPTHAAWSLFLAFTQFPGFARALHPHSVTRAGDTVSTPCLGCLEGAAHAYGIFPDCGIYLGFYTSMNHFRATDSFSLSFYGNITHIQKSTFQ